MVGDIDGKIHSKMAKMKTCYWFKKPIRKQNPILQRKARIRWLGGREISMIMISMHIISSWGEHLQEAEDVMGDGVRWLGGRWGVTLYFLYIVEFSCAGCIRRCGGLPISMRDENS